MATLFLDGRLSGDAPPDTVLVVSLADANNRVLFEETASPDPVPLTAFAHASKGLVPAKLIVRALRPAQRDDDGGHTGSACLAAGALELDRARLLRGRPFSVHCPLFEPQPAPDMFACRPPLPPGDMDALPPLPNPKDGDDDKRPSPLRGFLATVVLRRDADPYSAVRAAFPRETSPEQGASKLLVTLDLLSAEGQTSRQYSWTTEVVVSLVDAASGTAHPEPLLSRGTLDACQPSLALETFEWALGDRVPAWRQRFAVNLSGLPAHALALELQAWRWKPGKPRRPLGSARLPLQDERGALLLHALDEHERPELVLSMDSPDEDEPTEEHFQRAHSEFARSQSIKQMFLARKRRQTALTLRASTRILSPDLPTSPALRAALTWEALIEQQRWEALVRGLRGLADITPNQRELFLTPLLQSLLFMVERFEPADRVAEEAFGALVAVLAETGPERANEFVIADFHLAGVGVKLVRLGCTLLERATVRGKPGEALDVVRALPLLYRLAVRSHQLAGVSAAPPSSPGRRRSPTKVVDVLSDGEDDGEDDVLPRQSSAKQLAVGSAHDRAVGHSSPFWGAALAKLLCTLAGWLAQQPGDWPVAAAEALPAILHDLCSHQLATLRAVLDRILEALLGPAAPAACRAQALRAALQLQLGGHQSTDLQAALHAATVALLLQVPDEPPDDAVRLLRALPVSAGDPQAALPALLALTARLGVRSSFGELALPCLAGVLPALSTDDWHRFFIGDGAARGVFRRCSDAVSLLFDLREAGAELLPGAVRGVAVVAQLSGVRRAPPASTPAPGGRPPPAVAARLPPDAALTLVSRVALLLPELLPRCAEDAALVQTLRRLRAVLAERSHNAAPRTRQMALSALVAAAASALACDRAPLQAAGADALEQLLAFVFGSPDLAAEDVGRVCGGLHRAVASALHAAWRGSGAAFRPRAAEAHLSALRGSSSAQSQDVRDTLQALVDMAADYRVCWTAVVSRAPVPPLDAALGEAHLEATLSLASRFHALGSLQAAEGYIGDAAELLVALGAHAEAGAAFSALAKWTAHRDGVAAAVPALRRAADEYAAASLWADALRTLHLVRAHCPEEIGRACDAMAAEEEASPGDTNMEPPGERRAHYFLVGERVYRYRCKQRGAKPKRALEAFKVRHPGAKRVELLEDGAFKLSSSVTLQPVAEFTPLMRRVGVRRS